MMTKMPVSLHRAITADKHIIHQSACWKMGHSKYIALFLFHQVLQMNRALQPVDTL
jgi:hypothetical protein